MQRPVLPVEIESVGQRLPHPAIVERRAAVVPRQHDAHPDLDAQVVLALHQPALGAGRSVVGRHPVPQIPLDPEVEESLPKGLPSHRTVPIELVAQRVEVVAAPVRRDVASPVVRDPLVADVASRFEVRHPVGPAAEVGHEVGHHGIAVLPVVRRQDGHEVQDDEVGVRDLGMRVQHELPVIPYLDGRDPAEDVGQPRRQRIRLNLPDGVGDVARGDRHAVVPTRFATQPKRDRAAVLAERQTLRQVAVIDAQLVPRHHEQPVEGQARTRRLRPGRGERREGVKAGHVRHDECATLGRVRIEVVEVGVIRRILQLAEHRDTVAVVDGRAVVRPRQGGGADAPEQDEQPRRHAGVRGRSARPD